MFEQLTSQMDFMSSSLQLRAQRQQVIASNMANADTPGFVARDFDFAAALRKVTAPRSGLPGTVVTSSAGHTELGRSTLMGNDGRTADLNGVTDQTRLAYNVQTQPSLDNNSVDMDQQRANFTDNAIRYESTLRFINSHVKTMLNAIQGQ